MQYNAYYNTYREEFIHRELRFDGNGKVIEYITIEMI